MVPLSPGAGMAGIESPENVVGLLNTHKEPDFDCAPITYAN
jgi:hypothetical protein